MWVNFPGKKRYEGVRFNVISVTMGWVGVKFPEKQRYVTLLNGPHDVDTIAFFTTFIHIDVDFLGNEFLRFGENLAAIS